MGKVGEGAPAARGARLAAAIALAATALAAPRASADDAGSAQAEPSFDVMGLLARAGLHDPSREAWNAYGQVTDIWTGKLGFHAPYSGAFSLSPTADLSFTETATFYLGLRLWPGAAAYVVPEIVAERALSGSDTQTCAPSPHCSLVGLGGAIQDFELQKQGSTTPTPYVSRAYLRQTIDLGGARVDEASGQMQLGGTGSRRRIVIALGNFSLLDFFDKNGVVGDLRRSFFNMAFLTYAAYDFAADARGYTWGAVAELDYDDWAVRIARAAGPKDPNQLPLDFDLAEHYGDQIEIEHTHRIFGQDGVVRLLGYRNQEVMGRFADAIAAFRADPAKDAADSSQCSFSYGTGNGDAPDLCWVRRLNVKVGAGASVEQRITSDVGVFLRGMYSDGQTEVFSYTSTDRSISAGAIARGTAWGRRADTVGVGYSAGWISRIHAEYLALGGIDGFIGDGRLRQAAEQAIEAYYSLSLGSSAWVSADYQRIYDPAFNADRGPVDVFGARVHAEF